MTKEVTTDEQWQFVQFLDMYFLPRINNKDVRNKARLVFNRSIGNKLLGVRNTMAFLDIPCDFDDETIEPFVESFYMHLKNGPKKREKLPDEEKKRLRNKCNNTCNRCGNELSEVHYDHIIPFRLGFDTIPNNRQCLCPKCNYEKGNTIGRPNNLTAIKVIKPNRTISKPSQVNAYMEIA